MKKLINEKDLSEITGLALQTIRNARHERRGAPYLKIGGAIRYDLEDVETYLSKCRINPEGESGR